jgi:hypothetical protein
VFLAWGRLPLSAELAFSEGCACKGYGDVASEPRGALLRCSLGEVVEVDNVGDVVFQGEPRGTQVSASEEAASAPEPVSAEKVFSSVDSMLSVCRLSPAP